MHISPLTHNILWSYYEKGARFCGFLGQILPLRLDTGE